MRVLFWILGLVALPAASFSQGYVLFANKYLTVVDAPVFRHLDPFHDGPGPEWSAQLFLTNSNSLIPLAPSSTFRANGIAAVIAPRYFFSQTNQVPGVLPGHAATFIVRAWKTSFGSYEAAAVYGYVGQSLPVTVILGDAANPAPLIRLQSFEVGPLTLSRPRLTLFSPITPPTFSLVDNEAPFNTIEISTDLQNWSPYLAIFSKLRTFRAIDRSPTPLPQSTSTFFRVRTGEAISFSLGDWQKLEIARYRFKFERLCFCRPFSLSGTVEVQNGQIVSVTNARSDGVPVSNPDLTQFKTLEELYARIESASSTADLLVASYDQRYRYPRFIDIDYIVDAADDEITYYASEFEAFGW